MEISNPRIERQRAEIDATKAKIAKLQDRLRGQEKELRALEDVEIIAQFRAERMGERGPAGQRPRQAAGHARPAGIGAAAQQGAGAQPRNEYGRGATQYEDG